MRSTYNRTEFLADFSLHEGKPTKDVFWSMCYTNARRAAGEPMHEAPKDDLDFVKILEDPMPSPRKDLAGWFNSISEVAFFGKHDMFGYRNNVKANLRFFAALQMTAILMLVYFLVAWWIFKGFIPKFVDLLPKEQLSLLTSFWFTTVLTFSGVCGGIFWKEKASIHSKWLYLAGLYNEIIKTPYPSNKDEYPKREILEVALAIDILKMDMWSHESFGVAFKECLHNAIRNYAVPTTSGDFMINELPATGISRNQANAYLSQYHLKLFSYNKTTAA